MDTHSNYIPGHIFLLPLAVHFLLPRCEELILAQPFPFPACAAWFFTRGIGELLFPKKKMSLKSCQVWSAPLSLRTGSQGELIHWFFKQLEVPLLKSEVLTLLLPELLSICPEHWGNHVLLPGGQTQPDGHRQQTWTCLQLPIVFETAQNSGKMGISSFSIWVSIWVVWRLSWGSGCVAHHSLKAQNKKNI